MLSELTSDSFMRRMASSTPWVMDSEELGFNTRILVDWRRSLSVIFDA